MEHPGSPKFGLGERVVYSQSAERTPCPHCGRADKIATVAEHQNMPGTVVSLLTRLRMQCIFCSEFSDQDGYVVLLDRPFQNQLGEKYNKVLAQWPALQKLGRQ